ncbi:MAG TPA: glycoside hydrolase family 88 protein [Polyangiaceae bacterium]|nr:glycoside hydrolase family 88 protein [Polyangiaceae bacterium]
MMAIRAVTAAGARLDQQRRAAFGRYVVISSLLVSSLGCDGESNVEPMPAAGGRTQSSDTQSSGGNIPTAGTYGGYTGGAAGFGTQAGQGGTGATQAGAGGVGAPSTAGAAGSGGTANQSCAYQCTDRCVEPGAVKRDGSCGGGQVCCEAARPPETNPLAHLAASAKESGLLLAKRFSQQSLRFNSVANLPGDGYKSACEWYGALRVAKLAERQDLLEALVTKFNPLRENFVTAMTAGEAHVDRYVFGMVPLEIYIQTNDRTYLPLGTQTADKQQTTNQTRNAIDDMFMMTGLQLEAYRATKDAKYIDFMAKTMVAYLGAQQPNGLFFHNVTQAKVHWGRGNGWFAAGMAEMMRDLPTSSTYYEAIKAGYKKMMEGLLNYQGKNGLWYQVLDMPSDASNWEESSGSAMFTYAMIAGVRSGVLDAKTYVPVIDAAWAGLRSKISAQGDVSNVCVGTWYKNTAREYMALSRLTGDGHGQAPVLWAAAELLH